MEEKEHRFTATVLDKAKGKVTASGKVPEGANCLLTESELVIETDPLIRIPVARIRDSQVIYEYVAAREYASLAKQPTAQPLGTLRLLYADDLDQKHWLYLKMAEGDAGLINATLSDTIRKAEAQMRESLPFEMRYAGFGIRFLAYVIDGMILSAIGWTMFIFAIASGEAYVTQIITIAYFIGFWTWRGQTPGKMACSIQIIKEDGSPISFGRSVLRYVGYYVSGIMLLIGFLWIIWDRRKQGLHDKIAGTYVVRCR